ncbi:TBC1 domain family member 22A isoform X2 [Camelus ferus]|uniref:TBC1 domain family member 22A isoform X2 n=1 Tax=Camelus ferus TaxID=419612 RepID=A0A8B8U1D6_CAMFR|nr:TBC1 domain family member 22A isoform X2 [Camelus ferus]
MASDGARKQFWKRSNSKVPGSIQHVYGAQHPPFDPLLHGTVLKAAPKVPTTPLKAKRVSTFQEFESNTSDAWDAGEDEDELLALAAGSLGSAVVMETARRVLRDHSQRQGRPRLPEAPGPELRPQPSTESPPASSGDLRLVKSVSESHTSCPTGSASDTVPLQRSQSLPHSASGALGGAAEPGTCSGGGAALSEREASRLDKFRQLLAGPHTDLEELRRLSWSGIPKPVRPITWKLLSGYLPANVDRRPATLQRKQKEYFAFIDHYYDSRNDEVHQDTYRQIHIDIPRMSPEALILQPKVTEIFERILFIWAIRHPASGYVQGINDLVTPFFVVFICEYLDGEDVAAADVSHVPADVLRNVEADTYWCMSKLLDGIQDNYTFAQPGIQMKVKMLEELVSRIDVGTRGLRAFPLVRLRCFPREMEEGNSGRKRFSSKSCYSSSRTCPRPTGATRTSACCWPRPTASSLLSPTPPITTRSEPGPPQPASPALGSAPHLPAGGLWPGRGLAGATCRDGDGAPAAVQGPGRAGLSCFLRYQRELGGPCRAAQDGRRLLAPSWSLLAK